MLSRLAILIAFVLILAGCNRESYSRSSSGFSSLEKKALYDFRSDRPRSGAMPDAGDTRRVLSAVFPSYLSSARQCKSGASGNNLGQIVPAIVGSAEGSFTAHGLKQTAYLIDVGECSQSPASTARRLVVLTGGNVTANAQVPVGDAILGTYDLDADGKQELLLTGAGGIGQGELIRVANLVAFDRDKLAVVEDFGQIYDNTCDTDLPSKSISASIVYYLPPPAGQKPRFTVELYRAPCTAKGERPQWVRVSGR